jgi:hypothetical protein
LDAYYTPGAAIEPLIEAIRNELTGPVLDPCVGEGAIPAAFAARKWVPWITNDLDARVRADLHRDATRADFWDDLEPVDWVITNPPYHQADVIVEHAIEHARCGVAMLLRLSFLEPTRRRAWIVDNPPDRLIVLPRISYTTDGKTDTVTSAWMIWSPDYLSRAGIRIVSREELREWGYSPTRIPTASAV